MRQTAGYRLSCAGSIFCSRAATDRPALAGDARLSARMACGTLLLAMSRPTPDLLARRRRCSERVCRDLPGAPRASHHHHAAAGLGSSRARADHGRCRRRSERHRHLFAGRRPVRLFADLDHGADAAFHDGDPTDQRFDRLAHQEGSGGEYRHAPAAAGAAAARRAAGGRQHRQYRRRPRRHGRRAATGHRRRRDCSMCWVSGWSASWARSSCRIILCRLSQVPDLGAVRLCRGGLHGRTCRGQGAALHLPPLDCRSTAICC